MEWKFCPLHPIKHTSKYRYPTLLQGCFKTSKLWCNWLFRQKSLALRKINLVIINVQFFFAHKNVYFDNIGMKIYYFVVQRCIMPFKVPIFQDWLSYWLMYWSSMPLPVNKVEHGKRKTDFLFLLKNNKKTGYIMHRKKTFWR